VRSFSDTLNFTARAAARRVPVHELNDDITWVRGKHTLQFGGVVRFIRNNRFDDTLSFPRFFANNGFCTNLCGDAAGALRANRLPRASSTTTFTRAFMMLTGSITQVNGTFFADPKSGASCLPAVASLASLRRTTSRRMCRIAGACGRI